MLHPTSAIAARKISFVYSLLDFSISREKDAHLHEQNYFAETYLSDSPIAKFSLQASYARSISESPLPLKVIRSLTIPQTAIAQFCPYPTMRHSR
ncbi:hypothetical protein NIES2104_65640 [Leptolyngbya sp. NIES-2104]|nr:hypothetical protein NIES2104_65640 [Leptolyngbya sp. NIES-2104]